MIAPKPPARPERMGPLKVLALFRRDLLSALPAKLYRAKMAEYRWVFFRSYLINEPALVDLILKERPRDFPKSDRVAEGLRLLLGRHSVFITNGAEWERQRRIIDPAFEGGRLKDIWPAMSAAAAAAVARLEARGEGPVEIEAEASHAAADVIFRTLFSVPIDDDIASEVFREFRAFQRAQPVVNHALFWRAPRWLPRFFPSRARASAKRIRSLIGQLCARRMAEIKAGTAPDDLATKIMTTSDPETGERFTTEEMIDQVAIFFLAGHETSAAALSWSLALLAADPLWQDRVAEEASRVGFAGFSDIARLRVARDVFREALRLYAPVPMMVREARCPEYFRNRDVRAGSLLVLSPWHLHRHELYWDRPDVFDPARWSTPEGRESARCAYMPFSAGPRVCPGAGFAMIEGPLLIAALIARFRFSVITPPVPVAQLTVRAQNGIHLHLTHRA